MALHSVVDDVGWEVMLGTTSVVVEEEQKV